MSSLKRVFLCLSVLAGLSPAVVMGASVDFTKVPAGRLIKCASAKSATENFTLLFSPQEFDNSTDTYAKVTQLRDDNSIREIPENPALKSTVVKTVSSFREATILVKRASGRLDMSDVEMEIISRFHGKSPLLTVLVSSRIEAGKAYQIVQSVAVISGFVEKINGKLNEVSVVMGFYKFEEKNVPEISDLTFKVVANCTYINKL